MTKAELIAFEEEMAELFNSGRLPYCNHFSGGNETQLIRIFKKIKPDDWVFSTWRSHYHYLLKGGSPEKLREMIKAGRSMHIFDRKLKFFTSAIVGGCLPIATGVALAIKKCGLKERVWVFCGDGAVDEGAFYEAARYIDNFDLPCRIIVEDNGLAVDTPSLVRNGKDVDVPYRFKCVRRYFYNRRWPHVQTGKWVEEYL